MEQEYENRLINIENDVQDKTSDAWKKLCEYVEIVAHNEGDEFSPFEFLGEELFYQIHTLPASIGKLKNVKKIWLYGSRLKRIPPEIGEMKSLEYFDPYTSYQLHWFPYEIANCKNLKDSRVSTRALYGNHNYRRPFPDLSNNPVLYDESKLTCSICQREISHEETNQLWISLWVGTDVLPLLVNSCSKECERKLPVPPKAFVQFPHKGGPDLIQPTYDEWREAYVKSYTMEELEEKIRQESKKENTPRLLKLIRKIWEK